MLALILQVESAGSREPRCHPEQREPDDDGRDLRGLLRGREPVDVAGEGHGGQVALELRADAPLFGCRPGGIHDYTLLPVSDGDYTVTVDTKTCECHGVPKVWAKDPRKKRGGFWRCTIKNQERQSAYSRSKKGRTRARRYDSSKKGLARRLRYSSSEAGQAAKREWDFLNR